MKNYFVFISFIFILFSCSKESEIKDLNMEFNLILKNDLSAKSHIQFFKRNGISSSEEIKKYADIYFNDRKAKVIETSHYLQKLDELESRNTPCSDSYLAKWAINRAEFYLCIIKSWTPVDCYEDMMADDETHYIEWEECIKKTY